MKKKNTTSGVTIINYQLILNSHTLAFVCRKKIKHSRALNPASHTKGGSDFVDTCKKDKWTQQHVYMTEKSIENRFGLTRLKR